jgi:uncharacterized protein YndB with AHSA1/START domain
MNTHSVVIEKELPHPPEKIWRALTEGPLIQEWLMENDFQPTVGHKFSFRSKPVPNWNGIIESEVLIVDPNKKLSYTWGSLGLATVVVWTLAATKDGTLLRMEQSGFPDDKGPYYKGAQWGWTNFVGALERVLAGLA